MSGKDFADNDSCPYFAYPEARGGCIDGQFESFVTLFCEKWNQAAGQQAAWRNEYDGGPHEANFLKLDCAKLKRTFGWKPVWNIEQAMGKIVEWTLAYRDGEDIAAVMNGPIEEFVRDSK